MAVAAHQESKAWKSQSVASCRIHWPYCHDGVGKALCRANFMACRRGARAKRNGEEKRTREKGEGEASWFRKPVLARHSRYSRAH